jgi:hypothetical protein
MKAAFDFSEHQALFATAFPIESASPDDENRAPSYQIAEGFYEWSIEDADGTVHYPATPKKGPPRMSRIAELIRSVTSPVRIIRSWHPPGRGLTKSGKAALVGIDVWFYDQSLDKREAMRLNIGRGMPGTLAGPLYDTSNNTAQKIARKLKEARK